MWILPSDEILFVVYTTKNEVDARVTITYGEWISKVVELACEGLLPLWLTLLFLADPGKP